MDQNSLIRDRLSLVLAQPYASANNSRFIQLGDQPRWANAAATILGNKTNSSKLTQIITWIGEGLLHPKRKFLNTRREVITACTDRSFHCPRQ